jgi:hypothetical protein
MRSITFNRRPLWCALALCMLGLSGHASAAGPNLVLNGSFETGAFTNWTETGNNAFDGVQCPGAASVTNGNCDAYFGPPDAVGGITQSIATAVGSQYLITFDFLGDAGNPSTFQVGFGGASILNVINPANLHFQSYSFTTTASSANSLLSFQFRDDLGFMELDNVSVSLAPVPEPATWLSLGLGIALLALRRRRQQQAQS